MSRAPVEAPLRHNDPSSMVTSPHWLEWFQRSFDRLMVSFNGRVGTVMPQSGDYTAAQVGADPAGTAATGDAAHLSDYDHPGYDSHLAATGNTHGTEHSQLGELDADDHAQYLLLAGRAGQLVVCPLKLGDASHHSLFDADGTMQAVGNAICYKDVDIDLAGQTSGGSVPALIAVNGDTYLYARAYAGTGATVEQLGGAKELPHEMLFGQDIIPHVHWAAVSAAAGNVKWQLRTMLVNRNGTYTGGVTTSVISPTSGVAWQGQRSDFPAISTAGILSGARILFTLFRDPADADDTYTDQVIAPNFGVHVPVDMLGTRTIDDK
jgi:hypothetical protein